MQVCGASRWVGQVPGRVGGVLAHVLLARGRTQEARTRPVLAHLGGRPVLLQALPVAPQGQEEA